MTYNVLMGDGQTLLTHSLAHFRNYKKTSRRSSSVVTSIALVTFGDNVEVIYRLESRREPGWRPGNGWPRDTVHSVPADCDEAGAAAGSSNWRRQRTWAVGSAWRRGSDRRSPALLTHTHKHLLAVNRRSFRKLRHEKCKIYAIKVILTGSSIRSECHNDDINVFCTA